MINYGTVKYLKMYQFVYFCAIYYPCILDLKHYIPKKWQVVCF